MKNLFYFTAITLFLCTVSIQSKAQTDSSSFAKRWALSTDIILDVLNEKNIIAECTIKPHIGIGASYGRLFNSVKYENHGFIANHDRFPGRVYEGHAIKLFLKFYPKKNKNYYFQSALLYKNLKYDTARFYDSWGKGGVEFSRANEKANLFGLDFLFGADYTCFNYGYVDIFFGLGIRSRYRQYTTFYSQYNSRGNSSGYRPPIGYHENLQNYISCIAGFKLGFSYTK